jgi:hypothetical protein
VLEAAFTARTVACWLSRDPVPTQPSHRAHTPGAPATNDSPSSSSHEGVMPTHKGGTA